MKETAYIEKMAMYKKRKKAALNRLNSLEKEIKEQQAIIKKSESEMLNLSMDHAKMKVETLVDMIDKSVRVKDSAEDTTSAHYIGGNLHED